MKWNCNSTGRRLASWLFTKEELNLGLPKTNPAIGEENLNLNTMPRLPLRGDIVENGGVNQVLL